MTQVQMKILLQNCDYHAFLMFCAKLLARSGYGDVEIMGRRTPGQKTDRGGHELLCALRVGETLCSVPVKVLHSDSVRDRHLREMCGTLTAFGGTIGLVVSNRPIPTSLRRRLEAYGPFTLTVLGIDEIASLAFRHQVGVRNGLIDFEFFGRLEEASHRFLPLLKDLA